MLKPKRALVLSVISLLSSLICAVQSEYRTSSNGSSNNAEKSHHKYNHSSNINNISGSNVIEHNNPKAMKDLQRNPPPLDSANEKTAYQYAINDSDSGETPTIAASSSSSYPYFTSSSPVVHHIVENITFDGASEGPSTSTRLSYHHKKTAVRSASDNYHEHNLMFAILLPEKPEDGDSRILSTVRPVIEMATNLITGPQGILRNIKIEIDYRDTQCSSTYGVIRTFEMVVKREPGNRQPSQQT